LDLKLFSYLFLILLFRSLNLAEGNKVFMGQQNGFLAEQQMPSLGALVDRYPQGTPTASFVIMVVIAPNPSGQP